MVVSYSGSDDDDDDSQTTSSGENASLVYGEIDGTRCIWDLAGMEPQVMLGRTVNAKQGQQPKSNAGDSPRNRPLILDDVVMPVLLL